MNARLYSLLVTSIVFFASGCEPAPPNKPTGSKISGRVTFKNQPVFPGAISFVPDDPTSLSPVGVQLSEGGRYELLVPPGRYKVHIVASPPAGVSKTGLAPGGGAQTLSKKGIDAEVTDSSELNFDL